MVLSANQKSFLHFRRAVKHGDLTGILQTTLLQGLDDLRLRAAHNGLVVFPARWWTV